MTTFLHGGGGEPANFAPFVSQCRRIALIAVIREGEYDLTEYKAILVQAGARPDGLCGFVVTEQTPLSLDALRDFAPDGLLICGGETPAYHDLLCHDDSLASTIRESGVHFCGTSAGAMIASQSAIVGGWQSRVTGRTTQMIFSGAGEGLELLEIRRGMGLVPFAVDVHASQWGTLTRLIHTISAGHSTAGYAIDENTLLAVESGAVHGLGQVYHVQAGADGRVTVSILGAGPAG